MRGETWTAVCTTAWNEKEDIVGTFRFESKSRAFLHAATWIACSLPKDRAFAYVVEGAFTVSKMGLIAGAGRA